ncbi:TonB-dependent receptor plug domain-containing protein [Pedobacter heparinus]|uniref:TonB-dependent receptor plug domain-containing protein n=1 Tax=Pedobacter heparinus TaxID=984 RepID=UPI0029319E1A|nr:TonB-dependent receptor plug domain-containing protein [Pedobacter heparinus]
MKYAIISALFLLLSGAVSGQVPSKKELSDLISAVDRFTAYQSIEKLYLQTDKSAYASGDTLWFKVYLFDETYYASPKSGLMYIEIANDSNRLMKRIMLPVFNGISFGQIALDPAEIPQGNYVLRAYTNWMRNFGEDRIFQKQFYIGSTAGTEWLVNYNTELKKAADKDHIELSLKFSRLDKVHVALKDVQLQATDGKRSWAKAKMQTDIDGMLKVNLDLPEKLNPKAISLRVQDLSKGGENNQIMIPLLVNRPENVDLQFMPEGGNLVADLPSRMAFKAINEDGLGVEVSGTIYDSKNQQITSFKTVHKGMGAFYFSPLSGETYTARINGMSRSYPIPAAKAVGTVLSVHNKLQRDSCEVLITATPDVTSTENSYYLIGQARGVVCFAALIKIKKNGSRLRISKKGFPTGLVHITLARADRTVVNERTMFIDHADQLAIQVNTNKVVYKQRDSVAMHIKVTDKNGVPVQGNFSVAVTDDSLVKTDSIASGSVISNVLLTAGLKGHIEDPGYYLKAGADVKKWQDLDLLLLTQGWVGYNWDEIFKPEKVFAYAAEPEFEIKGKVTNIFNKPVGNSGINLLSKRPALFMDTVTNNMGLFKFKGIFPSDTAVFFIQARNKRGKSFNVGIEVEEFMPPAFTSPARRMVPWYVNIDTGRLMAVKKQFQLEKEVNRITGRNMLKEVAITAKKTVKDSKNLNGPGGADVIIDQQELEKSGKMTLGDLLEKRVVGFGTRTSKSGIRYYVIKGMLLHLIIDGVDVAFSKPEGIGQYDYFKQYFDYYDAEEIKGIEVMMSGKYQMRYSSHFIPDPMAIPWDHAFIEVTTRGGKGPFLKKSVGTYLYKPMAFSIPKKFYVPKYKPGNIADMTDIRSTIHWEPYIVTDKNGMATVSFYTADNPGSYSLIIEGADMKGNFGTKMSTIMVAK